MTAVPPDTGGLRANDLRETWSDVPWTSAPEPEPAPDWTPALNAAYLAGYNAALRGEPILLWTRDERTS